jgi:hypothetical protein
MKDKKNLIIRRVYGVDEESEVECCMELKKSLSMKSEKRIRE